MCNYNHNNGNHNIQRPHHQQQHHVGCPQQQQLYPERDLTMAIVTRRQQHSNREMGLRISKQHNTPPSTWANEERANYMQAIQRGEGCVNANRQLPWPWQCQNNIRCCNGTRTGNHNHKMSHAHGASARDKTMSDAKDNIINNKCCCCRQHHS